MTPEEQKIHPEFVDPPPVYLPLHDDLTHESLEGYWNHWASYSRGVYISLCRFPTREIIQEIQQYIDDENLNSEAVFTNSDIERVVQYFLSAAQDSEASMLYAINNCLDSDLEVTKIILRATVTDPYREENSAVQLMNPEISQPRYLRIEPNILLGVKVSELYHGHYFGDERDRDYPACGPLLSKHSAKISDKVLVIGQCLDSLQHALAGIQNYLTEYPNPNWTLLEEDLRRLELFIGENPDDLLRIAIANNTFCSSLRALSLDESIPTSLRDDLSKMAIELEHLCGAVCFEFDTEVSQGARKSIVSQYFEDEDMDDLPNVADRINLKIINVDNTYEWPKFVDALPDTWDVNSA